MTRIQQLTKYDTKTQEKVDRFIDDLRGELTVYSSTKATIYASIKIDRDGISKYVGKKREDAARVHTEPESIMRRRQTIEKNRNRQHQLNIIDKIKSFKPEITIFKNIFNK